MLNNSSLSILTLFLVSFTDQCYGWTQYFNSKNTYHHNCNWIPQSNAVNGIHKNRPIFYSTFATSLKMSTPQFNNRDRKPQAPPPPINQYIKADRVRLIAPGNETGDDIMLGIFKLSDALLEAEKFGVDLVMINDKGDPPVCKIIDYGKYKYAMEKKKKENMKKQVNVDIKEVKMSYKIDQHDFEVRMRAVRKFLGDGDKVILQNLFHRLDYLVFT